MLYLYYRLLTWLDELINHGLHPRLCRYVVDLFDKLPADKQAWENNYWERLRGEEFEETL